VAITTSFGTALMSSFTVVTDEVPVHESSRVLAAT